MLVLMVDFGIHIFFFFYTLDQTPTFPEFCAV